MTPKQTKTIEVLKNQIESRNARTGKADLKQFEIVESDTGLVFVVISFGLPKDEGTLASLLCRDYRHIKIGTQGGCELLNPKRKGHTINRGIFHCVHNLTS